MEGQMKLGHLGLACGHVSEAVREEGHPTRMLLHFVRWIVCRVQHFCQS